MSEEIRVIEELQEAIVDKQNFIIKNVSVLGTKSKNRRTYTEKAIDSSVRLFEGATAYCNHTEGKRDVRDILGRFENLRKETHDGVRKTKADLKLLEKEKWLLEVAEKMPKSIGFSISAVADIRKGNNEEIVEDIVSVNSIDLVDKPATTKGLFEEVQKDMAYTDEEKKRLEKLDEEIKKLGDDTKKIQEERKKLDEEKQAVEAEKKRLAIKEQAEKSLGKAATPGFLKLLEKAENVEEAINDRKAAIEEARKGFSVPQKDNTLPPTATPTAPDAGKTKQVRESIEEELKKEGLL